MIISREVDINVNRYGLRVVIPVVQYDSGRQIIFNIVDAELPSGCTSNIFIRKPSGKSVYNICTVSGNKVTVTLTNQSLSEYGFNDAQIQIIKGEEVVTSFSFILEVKQSDADNAVISKSESTFFQGIVNKAQAAATTAERVLDSIPDDYSQMSTKVNTNTTAITSINSNFMNLGTRGVYIPSNADLDTYRAPGIYDCNSGSVAVTLEHCPVTTGFRLIVETVGYGSMAYGFQTILLGSGAAALSVGGRVYRRVLNGATPATSAWGEWKELPTRSEVDANTAAITELNDNLYNANLGTIINNNDDLNTYTKPGTYYCNSSSKASTLANCPVNNAGFKLLVLRTGYENSNLIQIIEAPSGLNDGASTFRRMGDPSAWGNWAKSPTRAEVNANKTAIATNKTSITTNTNAIATLNNNLGGYKLVGYTASVVLNKAGEFIIPYPSGENFGTVYGILSATFLQGGYCLPNPPLTPSSTSPAYDISAAVAFRLLSTGIAIYTGGAWGADSRDIYFVLICKA